MFARLHGSDYEQLGHMLNAEWDGGTHPEALKAAYRSEANSSVRTRPQGLWMRRRMRKETVLTLTL